MMTKEEKKKLVDSVVKRIGVQKNKLWSLIRLEHYEEAAILKTEIESSQAELLDILLDRKGN